MIIYFSGTGNSRFVAKELGKLLEDDVISINALFKTHQKGNFHSQKSFVFVNPCHMSRMPMDVENFLMESHFSGHKDAYFIFTAGQAIGNAYRYCQKICQHHGLVYKGTQAIQMSANYVVMYDVLDRKHAYDKAKGALKDIQKIANVIKQNDTLKNDQLRGHKMYGMMAPIFRRFMVNDHKFSVKKSECIQCHQCVDVCPFGNIHLIDGEPVWNGHCMHCMACINICPQKIIQYGHQTQKRNRYYLELRDEIQQ